VGGKAEEHLRSPRTDSPGSGIQKARRAVLARYLFKASYGYIEKQLKAGEKIGEESCKGERRQPFLEYDFYICQHGNVVTYLRSLARGWPFLGPLLKVDNF
jgi:hypothetical protein